VAEGRTRPGRGGFVSAVLAICATALTSAPASQAPRAAAALDEITINRLQARMADGVDTSRSITERYLANIEALDRSGPTLRSVIEINPEALATADERDTERRSGRIRGPLHGIPIVVKDNIATGDRMLTSAGSLLLADRPAPRDAFLVTRLRDAGAVILGKTNLSEWANFRSTHSSSGWSARGGQTRNPYALDRNPSGSSSGTAVAVSANLAAAGIGTETDGSIVSPASINGLVGIKPTVGLISRTGIVPIAHSQDTAGPMSRTVADAALLLTVLASADAADDATTVPARRQADYTQSLDPAALRGARIGVVRNRLFGNSPAADAAAERAIALLRDRGAIVVDPAPIVTLGQFDESELAVLQFEFKADLPRFFSWWGPTAPARALADVIRFNQAHAAEELRYFGQELMTMSEGKGPLSSVEYRQALARNHRLSRVDGIDATMTKFRLDALVAPTGGPAWLTDLVSGDSGTASQPGPSTVAAVAGYPHITVPMGFDRGLPLGLSFIGRAWSEPTLIRIAYAFEQATHARRPPTFAPTADLSR
jgi:amidase